MRPAGFESGIGFQPMMLRLEAAATAGRDAFAAMLSDDVLATSEQRESAEDQDGKEGDAGAPPIPGDAVDVPAGIGARVGRR